MRKVILDVDTGSDDSFAIALALLCDKLDVIGITVTKGNNPVEDCVKNTLKVVELCGKDVPVYQGCGTPMVRTLNPYRNGSHGEGPLFYFDNGVERSLHPRCYDLPMNLKPQKQHAVSYLVETLINSDEKITIIPTGPQTNIGMALRMEPAIAEHIEEIICMGGAYNLGNAAICSEANFFNDPEAVKIVLESGVPFRIVALNATLPAGFDDEKIEKLESINELGKFLGWLVRERLAAVRHFGWGDPDGYAIHDALAVAALLDENVITEWEKCICDIEISGGIADGALLIDNRNRGGKENATIALSADKERYFEMICEAVRSWRK